MLTKIATGNADAQGRIKLLDGQEVILRGSLSKHFKEEDRTLAAEALTEVTIGGTSGEGKQVSYKGGYGDWASVVFVPPNTKFILEVISYGSIYSMAEVKVMFPDGGEDLAEKLYQYKLDKLNNEFPQFAQV